MIGLIPAAGIGSRLGKLTKALPKEMLQVGDKPIIEHVLDSFKEAGIDQLYIITGYQKSAIMDYLGNGSEFGMRIAYLFQEHKEGLAKAINEASGFINETFAVVLGDTLVYPKDTLKKLVEMHKEKEATASFCCHEIDDPKRFGVIQQDEDGRVTDLEEKPDNPKSNLAIVGMYVFEPEIFESIKTIKPGAKGEYQITDAMKILVEQGKPVYSLKHEGEWFDIGTKESYLEANTYACNNQ